MKKKLLIISSEFLPAPGGIGNHAYHLAKGLAGEGYNVTVMADITQSDEVNLHLFKQSLSFNFIPIIRQKIVILTYFERILKAVRLAGKNYSIICSGKFSLWLILLLRLFYFRKKTIAVVHGSELQLPSKLQRLITKSALVKFNKIVAVSHYTRSFIPDTAKERVECIVIPNGIDNDEFLDVRMVRKVLFPLQLVTVGSVTERKGQENVIKAMPDLLEQFPGLVYHVIGLPLITERLKKLCVKLAVESNVIFHGKLSREKLLKILDSSSVKLMISNHTNDGDFEGFGIAILEANACGLPVIVSNVSGTTDAVADKFNGRLIDYSDPAAIGDALKDIISNYQQYSCNAIQWADNHDWKIIVKQYISLIERACG